MSEPISQPPEASPIHFVPRDIVLAPPPRPATTFVGRHHEVETVTSLLGNPNIRLLTLTGPGGAGKTRLALHAAGHLKSGFPDGTAFVGLDATTDPATIPARVAQASGIPDDPGLSLPQRMRNHFRERRMLLIIDNLEHLTEASSFLSDLLLASQHLTMLCTSRVSLGIAAEQVYPVPPLTPGDATELFAQRARAVSPDFHDHGEWVTSICDRLEYLPLAIELAASRVALLPLPDLLSRLDRQLSLLTGGPRDAPARQQTMRDTVAWSYQLLEHTDQVLLRRLAVFSGGFSLEAAGQVCNDGLDALDGVSRLVSSGLARRIPGPADDARFRLPVIIREFAEERLDFASERDALRNRHAAFFLVLAESAIPAYDGPYATVTRDRVVAERDNCRTAMAWAGDSGDWETAIRLAGALWRTWWPTHAINGKSWTEGVEEGLDWIDRTLPHREDLPVSAIGEAFIGAGALNNMLGRPDASLRVAEELLALAEEQEYPYGIYWACFQIGRLAQRNGDLECARLWLERALEAASSVRNAANHASMALGCLSNNARDMGDIPEASRLAESAVACARTSGNPHNLSWLSLVAGRLRLDSLDPVGAVGFLIESTEAYVADDDPGGIRASITELGRVALSLDRATTARTLLVAVHELPAHTHDQPVHDAAMADLARRLGVTPSNLEKVAGRVRSIDELLDLARDLAQATQPGVLAAPTGLSPRELEVLKLVATGLSNRLIAGELSISERTVENHVLHILAKLGLETRTAAATWAVRHGLD